MVFRILDEEMCVRPCGVCLNVRASHRQTMLRLSLSAHVVFVQFSQPMSIRVKRRARALAVVVCKRVTRGGGARDVRVKLSKHICNKWEFCSQQLEANDFR